MTAFTPPPRRLDPCPCGSGQRYRDCHGSLAVAATAPPDPRVVEAIALRANGEVDKALARVEAALIQIPGDAPLENLRGLLRQDRLELPAALASFDAAIAAAPEFAAAHFNRALARLLVGDYAGGWADYAWRTRVPGYADYANHGFGMPRWSGEDLHGKRLLVHAEQGLGDTIQFSRFIAPLAAAGARIDVFCHPPLVSLMARVPGVGAAFQELATRPDHDFHAPIVDLAIHALPDRGAPHWFGAYVVAEGPPPPPLLDALASRARPRVGLAWKGSPRHANDRNRSLPRDIAVALACAVGAGFNLQQGEGPLTESQCDAASHCASWDDTAAVIASLELVVTVDTAVAHLAGAMGKPVWMLLPFSPDWRWGLEGEATPWYPTMRLFRQRARGDWDDVLLRVRAALG